MNLLHDRARGVLNNNEQMPGCYKSKT